MSAVHSTDTREGGDMQEIVAYCGLVCNECPAYEATQRNDNDARARVAEEWSKQFQHNFKAEDINCSGCLAVGEVQFSYCSMCAIRKCGSDRKVLNCAYCVEYPCAKLNDFHTKVAEAKAKLEAIRSKK
jgi:thiamine biosynthesis protein ThiC